MPKIRVHEKALAHLSRGLYRSPASAIRELVSNAWDANATLVTLNTNHPVFAALSVSDDGYGFTKADFTNLMSGGIGNSQKRGVPHEMLYGRRVIGRLGIGMLGIAQISGNFTVSSHPRSGEGFSAKVHLYDLLKEKLDKNAEEVVDRKDAALTHVDIGTYEFQDYDPKKVKRGTRILVDDIHPTFMQSFQESLQYARYKAPHRSWEKALKTVSKVASLQELGDYWRLLWELSAASPIPYISPASLPNHLGVSEQERLESYNFRVMVDGIELRKPVHLRGNKDGYTSKTIEPFSQDVYGSPLKFHGYILVQEGRQLSPDELRGIMIRIKDVGIGYYDQTMLDYRINQGPRSRWLTGEIIVDEGLEDALNIDRDSFNRFHPQFRVLQNHIHEVLGAYIFPKTYKNIEKRSKARKKSKQKEQGRHFKQVVANATQKSVSVRRASAAKGSGESTPDASVKESAKSVSVTVPKAEDLNTKKVHRELAAAILGVFEVAIAKSSKDAQRDAFKEMLLDLLRKW